MESALYKCVLKPLKEAINSCLREIHSKDGSLQQLKENQLVVLATTTTDLGVTTSVPEAPVMEKILQKLASMHKAYSPEKKISILLKTCKLIYDSMALGNPGRWAGGGACGNSTVVRVWDPLLVEDSGALSRCQEKPFQGFRALPGQH